MDRLTVTTLAGAIDHSCLAADATEEQLARACDEAVEWGFATVAINSSPVPFCVERLAGSAVKVCAAVGFPLGQVPTAVKVYEAQQALGAGAAEIDFVINIGLLKSGRDFVVEHEINQIIEVCRDRATTKVILETCYLTDAEKKRVIEMAVQADADFVKTATGTARGGATIPDVLLMRSLARNRIAVKAAGGIRTLDQALAFLDAGATRLGCSRSVAIMHSALEVLPR
jgi:deoxyribose-phosphate aldolase